jgi:hypothetical protein
MLNGYWNYRYWTPFYWFVTYLWWPVLRTASLRQKITVGLEDRSMSVESENRRVVIGAED